MIKLTKKKTLLQYGFLLFLIVITTYLVYTTLDIRLIPHIIKIVNIKYISLGIILMAIYIGLETYVTHIIVGSMQKTKVKGISFKLATMGLYYNLVTPFASGSQPMQIYAMTKYNIKFSKAVAIVTNKTVIYQFVVTLYCGCLIMLNLKLLNKELPTILTLMTIGMIINIGTLLVGILIMFNPYKMKLIANKIIDKLCKYSLFKSLENKKEKIDIYIDEFYRSIMIFIKDKKSLIISIIMTFIQLTIFFSITFCIYKTFNLSTVTYITLLTLQVFLYMSVSPVPTPGNVGANELIFLTIFAKIFPKQLIGYSVFLYSAFVYYMIVVICGICTIITHYDMSKIKKDNKKESYVK